MKKKNQLLLFNVLNQILKTTRECLPWYSSSITISFWIIILLGWYLGPVRLILCPVYTNLPWNITSLRDA